MRPGTLTPRHRARWLRPRTSTYWWLASPSYFLFILRELSSIFVAWFVLYLLMLFRAVGQGEPSYQVFLQWSRGPAVVWLNLVTLCFVILHAVTWFNLAPQAMVIKAGKTRVPGILIAASNYVAWLFVS